MISKINIPLKKDIEISKVDFKKLMKSQSDFIKEVVADKKEEIKKTALAKWEQKQKK